MIHSGALTSFPLQSWPLYSHGVIPFTPSRLSLSTSHDWTSAGITLPGMAVMVYGWTATH